jgi:hypothetical protein
VRAAYVQRNFDEVRDGRFARAWQAGQPQDRRTVVHKVHMSGLAHQIAARIDRPGAPMRTTSNPAHA